MFFSKCILYPKVGAVMNVLQVQGYKHEYETLGVGMLGHVPIVESGPP